MLIAFVPASGLERVGKELKLSRTTLNPKPLIP